MNHDEKVASVVTALTARGVSKGDIAPPIFRLVWKFGIAIPPPHFMSFGALATVMGSYFGVLWGVFMWFVFWRRLGLPAGACTIVSLAAGISFGVAMASFYRWKARQLGLPSWSEYGKKG